MISNKISSDAYHSDNYNDDQMAPGHTAKEGKKKKKRPNWHSPAGGIGGGRTYENGERDPHRSPGVAAALGGFNAQNDHESCDGHCHERPRIHDLIAELQDLQIRSGKKHHGRKSRERGGGNPVRIRPGSAAKQHYENSNRREILRKRQCNQHSAVLAVDQIVYEEQQAPNHDPMLIVEGKQA